MNYSDNEIFLIVINTVKGLEYKNKYLIYEKVKDISLFSDKIEFAKKAFHEIKDINESVIDNLFTKEYIEYVLKELSNNKETVVTIDSESYPESLREIENPPLVLYCKGDISLLNNNNFSIVGSRKCLPLSISIAERFSEILSDNGFTLVTGIAEGIDVTVIKSALKNNKKVISVVAGGLSSVYPKAHQNIFDEVIKKGLVITEQTYFESALPYMFPIRNRIIAGLSKGTLIVSASKKSGALYTAEFAMENGRDLFAVPYSIGNKNGEGTNDLIKRGAILTDCPQDILSYYGIEKEEEIRISLTDREKAILNAISDGSSHVEEIAVKTKLDISEVCSVLALMEIKKLVVKDGINEYGLCK
ncbi:MAG: DNA-processing protein DprA [Firmicutes bacterium]|nr:DNA-processing protein DprA [Candidatus Caballimonas caccae]